jgi:hypothetical protein
VTLCYPGLFAFFVGGVPRAAKNYFRGFLKEDIFENTVLSAGAGEARGAFNYFYYNFN